MLVTLAVGGVQPIRVELVDLVQGFGFRVDSMWF